jgi:hypothetical protein
MGEGNMDSGPEHKLNSPSLLERADRALFAVPGFQENGTRAFFRESFYGSVSVSIGDKTIEVSGSADYNGKNRIIDIKHNGILDHEEIKISLLNDGFESLSGVRHGSSYGFYGKIIEGDEALGIINPLLEEVELAFQDRQQEQNSNNQGILVGGEMLSHWEEKLSIVNRASDILLTGNMGRYVEEAASRAFLERDTSCSIKTEEGVLTIFSKNDPTNKRDRPGESQTVIEFMFTNGERKSLYLIESERFLEQIAYKEEQGDSRDKKEGATRKEEIEGFLDLLESTRPIRVLENIHPEPEPKFSHEDFLKEGDRLRSDISQVLSDMPEYNNALREGMSSGTLINNGGLQVSFVVGEEGDMRIITHSARRIKNRGKNGYHFDYEVKIRPVEGGAGDASSVLIEFEETRVDDGKSQYGELGTEDCRKIAVHKPGDRESLTLIWNAIYEEGWKTVGAADEVLSQLRQYAQPQQQG